MKKVILDTDIGGDCDDMGAFAILHHAYKKKLVDWKAITLSTENPYSAACADAVNKYYNFNIPIGQIRRFIPGEYGVDFTSFYGKYIAENFKNSFFPNSVKLECAVRLLRKVLSENRGDKITLILIGCSSNIADLLVSNGDDISPLTGLELMEAMVDEIIIMGCYFPEKDVPKMECGGAFVQAEWNIKIDIPSAQILFDYSPVPITVCPFSVGYQLMTGKQLISAEPNNPVAVAYKIHSRGDRDSWDPATVYYAICRDMDCFSLSDAGMVNINKQGVSSFTIGKGRHRILSCRSRTLLKEKLDKAMLGFFD